jgi:hypothetical protein
VFGLSKSQPPEGPLAPCAAYLAVSREMGVGWMNRPWATYGERITVVGKDGVHSQWDVAQNEVERFLFAVNRQGLSVLHRTEFRDPPQRSR